MKDRDLFSGYFDSITAGVLLSIFLFVALASLFYYVFYEIDKDAKPTTAVIQHNDDMIKANRAEIETLKAQLDQAKIFQQMLDEIAKKKSILTAKTKEIEKLQQSQEQLWVEFETKHSEFDNYRQKYRDSARRTLVNRTYETLTTLDGKTYHKVKVNNVDPVRMGIRHEGGLTGIDLTQLPEEIQQYLQLDQVEREQFLSSEKTTEKQLVDAVHAVRTEADKGNLLAAKAELEHKISSERNKLKELPNLLKQLNGEVRAKREQLLIETRKSGLSRAYQVRQELKQLEGRIAKTKSASNRIQAKIITLQNELDKLIQQIDEIEKP